MCCLRHTWQTISHVTTTLRTVLSEAVVRHCTSRQYREASQMPVRYKHLHNVWKSAIAVGQHRSESWLKFENWGALGHPNAAHSPRSKRKAAGDS